MTIEVVPPSHLLCHYARCGAKSKAKTSLPDPQPANPAFKCEKGCKDVEPPVAYCSEICQKKDLSAVAADKPSFSPRRKAYTLETWLAGSCDPVIVRTFTVPEDWDFGALHMALQHAYGWQTSHMHEFRFEEFPPEEGDPDYGEKDPSRFFFPKRLMSIAGREPYDFEDEDEGRFVQEDDVKLRDVFEEDGKYAKTVRKNGKVQGLVYEYDMGDSWIHMCLFKGSQPARSAWPVFSEAKGHGPIDDCGGIEGWDGVKEAFEAKRPNVEQRELKQWARSHSGQGSKYTPLKEPELEKLNDARRWGCFFEPR
ncbi:hypothetical protein MNV49_007775 [Pseudohyphozyma bogoriensis]|nr:hypothetical protein MNV49_007775 [Pseudohyphozyma bogoriensis]